MTSDERYLSARIEELSKRAYNKGIWTNSTFLTLAEQALVHSSAQCPFELVGGYDGAERRIAFFGSVDLCGYEIEPPIKAVMIMPLMQKFADKLTHRDFLGSIMALGIKREMLGDIIVSDNCGFLVCLDSISDFIADNLLQVKHTTVRCTVLDKIPNNAGTEPVEKAVMVSSLRMDAVIAAVYKFSRSESKELFDHGKVFINSKICISPETQIEEGCVVSVRGNGRFKFLSIDRRTQKGKLMINLAIY